MISRFTLSLLLFILILGSVAQAQTGPQRHAQLREALERHDLLAVERMLREIEKTEPGAFARNHYDYLLARVLDRRGAAGEATVVYQKVVARNSLLAGYALWHLAELQRAAGNLAEEQKLLARFTSQYLDHLWRERALARLGASYFKTGQYEAAITAWKALSGQRGAVARDSLVKIGEAQLTLKQTSAARATFESVTAGGSNDDASLRAIANLDSMDEAAHTTLTEAERLRRARIYQTNRRFAEARRHWLALVSHFPQSAHRAEALFQLGRGYFLEDNFAEAIPWYNRVHDEFPKTDEGEQGFYYVGHCYQYLNDADHAIARYEEFLKAYPRSDFFGTAHLNAIDTLRAVGRLEDALKWAARAQTDVKDPFITVTGLFHQARIHLAQEDHAAALADFTALRSRNLAVRGPVATTNSAEVAFMRAYCLEKLGHFEEAINEYLTLNDGRNNAHGYYGHRASDRLRALGTNARAKNLIATRLNNYLTQARAAHTEGNAAAAKAAANQALRLATDEQTRGEMLKILRAAYAKLPGYQLPSFNLIPAGRTAPLGEGATANGGGHQALANELFFLGLYDEGAPELAAAQNGNGTASRDWAYSLAVYSSRGNHAERAIKFAEPLFNSIPDDYRVELLPRALAEMLYPAPYRDALVRHAVSRNVDPRFVLSIARQESRFNPSVKSVAAARGLLQFISSTSEQIVAQLKLSDFEQDDLYHPSVAILIGSQYMQNLFNEFKTPQAAAAAYNGSEVSVRRWLARTRSPEVDRFVIEIGKRETKDYVFKVMNGLWAYQALYQNEIK
jgi:soluble lytic murein transglycosylase